MKFRREKICEEFENRLDKAVSAYKRYAGDRSDKKINETALARAAAECACEKFDLRDRLEEELNGKGSLTEASIDQVVRQVAADAEEVNTQTDLDKVLDRALRVALRKQKAGDLNDFPNIMIISEPGLGKTTMVKTWAKKNDINLVPFNLGMADSSVFSGIMSRDPDSPRKATPLETTAFDRLDDERSVLFVDEYNRAKTETRGLALTFIQDHELPIPGNPRRFPNWLFTIACINPEDDQDPGIKPLGAAERDRFRFYWLTPSVESYKKFITALWKRKIAGEQDEEEKAIMENQLGIAEKILSSKKFNFTDKDTKAKNIDDPMWKGTTYRGFKQLLENIETKEEFIDEWADYCDPAQQPLIETLLSDYVDIDDRASRAMKYGYKGGPDDVEGSYDGVPDEDSEEEVFNTQKSNMDKIRAVYDNLDD